MFPLSCVLDFQKSNTGIKTYAFTLAWHTLWHLSLPSVDSSVLSAIYAASVSRSDGGGIAPVGEYTFFS